MSRGDFVRFRVNRALTEALPSRRRLDTIPACGKGTEADSYYGDLCIEAIYDDL